MFTKKENTNIKQFITLSAPIIIIATFSFHYNKQTGQLHFICSFKSIVPKTNVNWYISVRKKCLLYQLYIANQ